MRIAGCIVFVLAALLLALCWTRIRVLAAFSGGAVTLDVRFGLLRFRSFPAREAPQEKEEARPQKGPPGETAPKAVGDKKRTLPKFTLGDAREAAAVLWPPLKRALGRTRRGIRIEPLDLSLTVGAAGDPAAGAALYGELHCAVWTGMPMLEQVLCIPSPHIHLGIDFDTEKTGLDGSLGVSIRMGTALAVAVGIGRPAVGWLLGVRKRQRTGNEPPETGASGKTHTAA